MLFKYVESSVFIIVGGPTVALHRKSTQYNTMHVCFWPVTRH